MFEHSVKVPRHYKVAANIFKKVSTEGGSVKTLLYDDKLRHFRTNVLYALITETIKHAADIDKIFENCKILENESRLDPWLAKVLTAELLFGKKTLPGKSKPEQTIFSYKEKFEQYTSAHQDELKPQAPDIKRPRYVRINTNLLTTSDAIRAFQDEGYKFIRCTSGLYEDYLKQIKGLTVYDFTQDYHVKTMFVFAPGTKMHEHELYLENKIILQDKATAMAVHLLAPPPGSVILDMCAAPGMKTTQLAAYLRNEGTIHAIERNEKRYQTLCDFVEKTSSTCVKPRHKDVLDIKRGEYEDVEYILLDPSCSGSGMDLSVHNYIEAARLAKLTSLQEKFLKHAMNAFPKAKRIVYSTCSIFPEENERVITNVVKTSRAKWRVQDVKELLKGQWENFGSAMYGSMGTRCMYSRPDSDMTTGFFLAVLDRDPKDLEKNALKATESTRIKNENLAPPGIVADDDESLVDTVFPKNLFKKDDASVNNINEDLNSNEKEIIKKKKKKNIMLNEVKSDVNENENNILDLINQKKKKLKKVIEIVETLDENEKNATEVIGKKKKKKKKAKDVNKLIENFEDLYVNQINGSETENLKKNRKHKLQDEVSDDIIGDPNIIEDISETPKKKKKKHDEVEAQIVECEITTTKKKKRKREKLEIIDIEKQFNDEIITAKKKKKKKDKIVLTADNINVL